MVSVFPHDVAFGAHTAPDMFESFVFVKVVIEKVVTAGRTFRTFKSETNRNLVQNSGVDFFDDFFALVILQNRQMSVCGLDPVKLGDLPKVENTTDSELGIVVHRVDRNILPRFIRQSHQRANEVFGGNRAIHQSETLFRDRFGADRPNFVHDVIVGGNVFAQHGLHFRDNIFV